LQLGPSADPDYSPESAIYIPDLEGVADFERAPPGSGPIDRGAHFLE